MKNVHPVIGKRAHLIPMTSYFLLFLFDFFVSETRQKGVIFFIKKIINHKKMKNIVIFLKGHQTLDEVRRCPPKIF